MSLTGLSRTRCRYRERRRLWVFPPLIFLCRLKKEGGRGKERELVRKRKRGGEKNDGWGVMKRRER